MKPKVVKSAFMLVIATCFSSLCLTFAWFTSKLVEQNNAGNISLTGMDGQLYYYNGNQVDGKWCGFLESEPQKDIPGAGFTAYDPNAQDDPFLMQSAKPSSRFLFYFEAKVKDSKPDTFTVDFGATDWNNNPPVGETFPKVKETQNGQAVDLTLSRAIHFYTRNLNNEGFFASTNKAENEAKVLAWCDSLMYSNDNQIYTRDKFNKTTQTNQDGNALVFDTMTFNKETTYIIPFLMEFTNDSATFCSPTANANEYVLDPNGSSNAYMGMKFYFTEIFLSHIGPPSLTK